MSETYGNMKKLSEPLNIFSTDRDVTDQHKVLHNPDVMGITSGLWDP